MIGSSYREDQGDLYGSLKGLPAGAVDDPVHSRLSPSKAYQWGDCTASVSFIEANDAVLPKDSSKEADEGTRAHDAASAILKGADPAKVKFDNDEMKAHVLNYVEFVRTKVRPGDTLVIERRVPLFYYPQQRGTMDAGIFGSRAIYIADLKFGKGVGVYAKNNRQLASYAESAIREMEEMIEIVPDNTLVTLAIYQPRDRNDPNAIRLWVLSRKELREFCAHIQDAADDILAHRNLKFAPGDACKFCRATGICKAYGSHGLVALGDEPVDTVVGSSRLTQLASPDALTREQRQRVLASKSTLIAWLEAVENQEVAEQLSGAPPMDFKLVEGKSNRAWADLAGAEKLLLRYAAREKVLPPVHPELVSPAQAEKLLTGVTLSDSDKEELANLITKPKGKPTLVPVTDKRPALEFDPNANLYNLDADPSDLI